MAIEIHDNLWRQASCADMDTEVFFPENPTTKIENTLLAKSTCRSCPIQNQCLEFALENDEKYGIWGGLTALERHNLRRVPRTKAVVVKPISTAEKERLAKIAAEANARRTLAASYKVVKELRQALEVLDGQLPDDVKDIIQMRIENPELSLRAIGELMLPPVSKDVVSGKIRRTLDLAKMASK